MVSEGINFQNEEEVKKYLDDLGTEYRFSCLHENNPEGCHLLGRYLETIKENYKKAALIFKNNCDDNKYPISCLYYGNSCYRGLGVGANPNSAVEYFKKGCELKDAESCFHAGIMLTTKHNKFKFENDYVQGLKYLEEGCRLQNSSSCFTASSIYINGAEGVPADMEKASELSKKSCELGNALACINLYQMYKKGDGVTQNESLAQQYKKKAIAIRKELKNKQIEFQEFT